MGADFDLFGDPVPEGRGKPGRPPHVATLENRNKVKMLMAFGWNNERIAGALGITAPSLRKHYFLELKQRLVARDKLEARLGMLLLAQCVDGSVAAHKEFRKLLDRNDQMSAAAEFSRVPASGRKAEPVEKIGKKAQADLDASTAASSDDAWNRLLNSDPPQGDRPN